MRIEPLVFWREGKGDADGRRRGLACAVAFCSNPDCSCAEATLHAVEIDERFQGLRMAGEKVRLDFRGGEPQPLPAAFVDAVVNLDSGEVVLEGGAPLGPKPAELVGWLRDAMDGATLAALKDRWARFKEARRVEDEAFAAESWKGRDWTRWNGRDPIP